MCVCLAQVVKTRLMVQAGGVKSAGMVQYEGVVDCFVRLPQLEGPSALYKGFVPSAWATAHPVYTCTGLT